MSNKTVVWLKRSVIVLAVIVFLIGATATWLLRTQSGARQLVNIALNQIDGNISLGDVEGSIVSGLSLRDVRFESPELLLKMARVDMDLKLKDLLSRSLNVQSLIIDTVAIVQIENSTNENTPRTAVQLPAELSLPVDVLLNHLQVKNAQFSIGSEPPATVMNELVASANWVGTTLTLTSLNIKSVYGTVEASGIVTTKGRFPVEVTAQTLVRTERAAPINATIRMDGDLHSLNLNSSFAAPYSLEVTGKVVAPLEQPQLDLLALFEQTGLAAIKGDLPDLVLSGKIGLTGSVENLAVSGKLSSNLPDAGTTVAEFSGVVFPNRVQITRASFSLPDTENTPTLSVSGKVESITGNPSFDAELNWEQLRWPLQTQSLVRSRQGTATLKGTTEEFVVTLKGGVATSQEPDGTIELSGRGNTKQFDLNIVNANVLQGSLAGQAEVGIQDGLTFKADLRGTGLNPAHLDENWPGKINFIVSGAGKTAERGIEATVSTLKGSGQLRGFPVDFTGKGHIAPGRVKLEQFDLQSGDTNIRASGNIAENIDLTWDIDSNDLGSLWPGLQGRLEAGGVAGGTVSSPTLKFSANGESLEYKDTAVDKLVANVEYATESAGRGVAKIVASGLTVGEYESEQITVDVQGAAAKHTINIDLTDSLGESTAQIHGNLTGLENPDDWRYDFDIANLSISPTDLGTWSLLQPTQAQATRTSLNLKNTCLAQKTSTLCLSLESSISRIASRIDVSQVPLSLFSHLIPSAIRANGTVNGGGEFVWSESEPSIGKLHFDIDPMMLESRFRKDATDSTLQFNASTLEANIDDIGTISLAANFPLTSGGGIDFSGTVVAGQQKLLDRGIDGDLALSIPSIGFVTGYIPQISQAEGQIEGVIKLTGSIQRPQLLGSFDLRQGALTLMDPGVQATDVELSITGNRDSSLTLTGSAKSGGGDMAINGALMLGNSGYTGTLKLTGNSFQIVNTQEAQIWATPDIKLEYGDAGIDLEGRVLVPRANVKIDALPKGTVKVSKDQIIVGDEQSAATQIIPFSARLELELGDDVHLNAFGLDAFLNGAVTIVEKNSKPPTATGEITLLKGKYEAYGQSLDITTGRLVYAGGPLDEPGIDLRAVRSPVPGIEVGVSARGSISQPRFNVFSTPVMSESDQLAYLIFGRPISAEATSESTLITRAALTLGMQGGEALTQKLADELGVDQLDLQTQGSGDLSQASLVIGKYLSPKLFVSYGIGLLDPVSTLKLEYALSSSWQLVTESSSTRTSADAQYTIER